MLTLYLTNTVIENETKSILYTGDIRSEPSMINNLKRNPLLIEYTTGLKTLDCIYLDTSNNDPDLQFPEQHEGLAELIAKVKQYPKDTIFHFAAWTYGYEKVWLALSHVLGSQIHVDTYKRRIFRSLSASFKNETKIQSSYHLHEAATLAGFYCGNSKQEGCLTDDPTNVRIHSCEKGTKCPVIENNPNVVWITPIVARLADGTEIAEVGVGGGGGDLKQHAELELCSEADVDIFLAMMDFGFSWSDQEQLREKLLAAVRSSRMTISLDDLGLLELEHDQNEMSLEKLAALITQSTKQHDQEVAAGITPSVLPKRITFPYARHSSFEECVALVAAFKPKDVYPCTVDEQSWHEGLSMKHSYSKYCTDNTFRHDHEMRQLITMQREDDDDDQKTHTTESESSDSGDERDVLESVFKKPPLPQHSEQSSGHSGASARSGEHSTPRHVPAPAEIIAISPNSQSQNLRRTLIMAGLENLQNDSKRPRLDDSPSGESTTMIGGRDTTPSRLVPAVVEQSLKMRQDHVLQQGIEEDASSSCPGADTPTSSAENVEPHNEAVSDKEVHFGWCEKCHAECWYEDYCTACDGDRDDPPYRETIDDGEEVLDVVYDEFTDVYFEEETRREMLGADEYLDVDSEAYDTMDEEGYERSELEVASWIDDRSDIPSNSSGKSDESDGEGDDDEYWEIENASLQRRLEAAEAKLEKERQAHQFTRVERDTAREHYFDLLERQEEDYYDEDEDEIDENGLHLVNPVIQNPTLAEVVLAHVNEESQSSATSGRIRDRIDAANDAEQGWGNVSIVSAGFNHTEEEIEL